MTWARTDDGMLDHPNWVRAVRLGGAAAVHLWLAALHWCSRHLTDGEIPVDLLDAIGGPRGARVRARAFRALAEASLTLQRSDGGITLVNYCEFNPSRAKVLEDRGRRAKAQQHYADRKKLTHQQSIELTNHQTITDDVPARPGPAPIRSISSGSASPSPDPRAPFDASEGTEPTGKAAAEAEDGAAKTRVAVTEVFVCWQTTHGKQRAKVDAKRAARIRARLAEGFTVEQLCQAIRGALKDPFLTGADPKAARAFDGIETILRDAAQVERLIALEEGGAPAGPKASRDLGSEAAWLR